MKVHCPSKSWPPPLERAPEMVAKDSIFRYADGVDMLLMLLGTLGSIGDGLQTPLTMFILSDVINDYGVKDNSLTNDIVDKVSTLNSLV